MNHLRFFIVLATLATGTFALRADNGAEEAAYTRAITKRAERIVATLGLDDPEQAARVRDVIANQYRRLRAIHDPRDARIAAVKAESDGADAAARIEQIKTRAKADLADLHARFLGELGSELTPAQVVAVKDGMTYNVLHVTYKAFTEMIPTLTAAQKRQIMAWLGEAREHAMDAGSSEAKHAWFGKYKGRINNYLSAAGIDLKQAEKDWAARRKAERSRSQANHNE